MAGTRQLCDACGCEYAELHAGECCDACGGLLSVEHAFDARADAAEFRRRFAERVGDALGGGAAASGVWRYRELVLPSASLGECISHPEGNTPLLSRDAISRWAGIDDLLIKHEGHNPTGSFKDRGMTVAITQARRSGAAAVACASTGNTSASLASYAAHAGIPAVVFVPDGQIAMGKLAQTLAYGALTLEVPGDFDACLTLARRAAGELNMSLLNSVNPFRIEGQKSIVLELLQQLDWEAPDWIVLPAGNLGNTAAFGKALREARALGLITCVPRLAAVQAAGAAPFAASFDGGFAQRTTVSPRTIATAIRIGAPASFDRAVRAIRETNGVVIAVTDDELLESKAVIDASGVGCEPASAASVAGARALRSSGRIGRSDRVVAVLTGNMLKDPGVILDYHQGRTGATSRANAPVKIARTVDGVRGALRNRASRP